MFEKVIGKCTEVVVKHGVKFAVAGVGCAIVGTASWISYEIGRKKGDEEGRKSASEIYGKAYDDIAAMFD